MIGVKGYYWPPGVARDDSLESWIKVFEIHGYRVCETGGAERDVEKIAIYGNPKNNAPAHVSRQKKSGAWVSKLGSGADIEHDTLNALNGDVFGEPIRFMRRPRHAKTE